MRHGQPLSFESLSFHSKQQLFNNTGKNQEVHALSGHRILFQMAKSFTNFEIFCRKLMRNACRTKERAIHYSLVGKEASMKLCSGLLTIHNLF